MKIQKTFNENYKKTRRLVEDAEEEKSSVVENPAQAPVSKIADAIIDAVEIGTDGKQTVAPAEANKVAKEAKDLADDIDTAFFASSYVENDLTRVFDKALARCQSFRKQRRSGNTNVLVTGLPGSGKTSIFLDWAHARGLNPFYLNAKDQDLEAAVSGFSALDKESGQRPKVVKAFSEILAPLDRPNSILFLDELNRQSKPGIRAALLTLINEKRVAGDGPDGYKHFDNLLFTVACINPAVPTDPGAFALNDAERTRYGYSVQHDSGKLDALDYYKDYYTRLIANMNFKDNNFSQEDILANTEEYVRELALAITIVGSPQFEFDGYEELEELADEQKDALNQRELTSGIENSYGHVDMFLNWVDHETNLLDKNKQMLHDILDSCDEATIIDRTKRVIKNAMLDFNRKGKCSKRLVDIVFERIDALSGGAGAGSKTAADDDLDASASTAETTDDDDFETDTGLFGQNRTSGSRIAPSKAEKLQRLASFNW